MLTFSLKCPDFNICITDGDIASVSNACLAVYLHFKSLSSWIAFFDKYLTGEIKQVFDPLQKELRKQHGLENVTLEVIVFVEDFQLSVKTIGTLYITKSILITLLFVCVPRFCVRANVYACVCVLQPLKLSLGMNNVSQISK